MRLATAEVVTGLGEVAHRHRIVADVTGGGRGGAETKGTSGAQAIRIRVVTAAGGGECQISQGTAGAAVILGRGCGKARQRRTVHFVRCIGYLNHQRICWCDGEDAGHHGHDVVGGGGRSRVDCVSSRTFTRYPRESRRGHVGAVLAIDEARVTCRETWVGIGQHLAGVVHGQRYRGLGDGAGAVGPEAVGDGVVAHIRASNAHRATQNTHAADSVRAAKHRRASHRHRIAANQTAERAVTGDTRRHRRGAVVGLGNAAATRQGQLFGVDVGRGGGA